MNTGELVAWVRDARERTIELVADLTDEQLMGPKLAVINPFLWEIGHVAWFQEKWVLRGAAGQRPLRADGDSLYDSAAIPHDTRWDLPLPSREGTLAYMRAVRDRVIERIEQGKPDDKELYFIRLSVFHEDMHTEAFTYTRQTLAYPSPTFSINGERAWQAHVTRQPSGAVRIPATRRSPAVAFCWEPCPGNRLSLTTRSGRTRSTSSHSRLRGQRSHKRSLRPSLRIKAISVANSGARKAGAGGRVRPPNIRYIGSGRAPAGGCGAISTAGQRWSRIALCFTSTGGKRKPTAGGRAGGFRTRRNGRSRPPPSPRPAEGLPRSSVASRGEMIHQPRIAPTWVGARWAQWM